MDIETNFKFILRYSILLVFCGIGAYFLHEAGFIDDELLWLWALPFTLCIAVILRFIISKPCVGIYRDALVLPSGKRLKWNTIKQSSPNAYYITVELYTGKPVIIAWHYAGCGLEELSSLISHYAKMGKGPTPADLRDHFKSVNA